MIRLMVRKMCHDCPQFNPVVDTLWENNKPHHVITCINSDTCREIRRYLIEIGSEKLKENLFIECGTPYIADNR